MWEEKRVWLDVDLVKAELEEMLPAVIDAVALGAPIEVVKKGYGAQGNLMYDECPRCETSLAAGSGTVVSHAWRARCASCGFVVDDIDWYVGLDAEEVAEDLAGADADDVYQVWDDTGALAVVVSYDDGKPSSCNLWKGVVTDG